MEPFFCIQTLRKYGLDSIRPDAAGLGTPAFLILIVMLPTALHCTALYCTVLYLLKVYRTYSKGVHAMCFGAKTISCRKLSYFLLLLILFSYEIFIGKIGESKFAFYKQLRPRSDCYIVIFVYSYIRIFVYILEYSIKNAHG
ncbi:hypothetical protein PHYBLDRAFT_171967 [Phycomyces blakesleeanus NRRL 1555(-)]|uniref:Uncharacterized protein n=1 Tax=Phycomyces blakesleeanus (strain ATCC 8743b / DSM 1359 / FGSC 10004 / NBRC 33097 / NRRL 1555) TaxID=763407 RepID=A0A167LA39_PHYB8|nr:hypothetical protein PHYBLDRAFT_171967 [Phycomyces blakesleeanus NRRL 1555(-)]OAD69947.1 hypothetical protein PHYBLDRAFT_171967 [Phycomyces blakesleeanus NRRL 1555(-)]|eukprot:XP_018287987.1 hypothetical protein PHYBLDRAFT_171967 [Phycomyces blakesleeanus NRRL 1555(-)]